MATAKNAQTSTRSTSKAAPTKTAAPAKKAAGKTVSKATATASDTMKPVKEQLNKSGLIAHLALHSGVEPKQVKAVMSALEATVAASLNKKGAGAFTLPGLVKITAVKVAATKKRRGIDPFTKVEREFAAKPATVKVKVRALKKMKDAALA